MTDDRRSPDSTEGSDEYELEVEEIDGDVESALEEALRAVEDGERRSVPDREQEGVDGEGGAGSEVGDLRSEIAELRDRSMRTLADFDNYRKRMQRERADERRFATFEVLREFLDVIDNLERALQSGGSFDDLKVGVEMIHRQMDELLRRHGVLAVEAVGATFDPTRHEAVQRRETDEVDDVVVERELARGYMMDDRLLRPAMVTVAVPPRSGEPLEKGPEND